VLRGFFKDFQQAVGRSFMNAEVVKIEKERFDSTGGR